MENPRNTPRLETPRLILRRFVPEDAPALWELLRDREVNRFLPWFPVETLAEAEKFLRERLMTFMNQKDRENGAQSDNSGGRRKKRGK